MKKKSDKRKLRTFQYDVCLSFSGKDRLYVRKVAKCLNDCGVRVFFDEYAEANMWGKDLYAHLDDIYQNAARYCLLFISKHYAKNVWTSHERESAQARAIKEHVEYILPARFDSTRIPGMRSTVSYVDLKNKTPRQLADILKQKLGAAPVKDYFPPTPDRLFKKLGAKTMQQRGCAEGRAYAFFRALTRMNADERRAIFTIFLEGCPAELPDNIHINLDLLRRSTGFPASKLLRILSSLQSVGFRIRLRKCRKESCLSHEGQIVVAEWHDMSINPNKTGNATLEAHATVTITASNYCEKCFMDALLCLDFTSLSSATRVPHTHE